MSKASVICEACGENNDPFAEFCIGCGSKLTMKPSKVEEEIDDENTKYKKERDKYFKSVPTMFAVIIFLLFIDWQANRSIE